VRRLPGPRVARASGRSRHGAASAIIRCRRAPPRALSAAAGRGLGGL